MHIYGWVTSTCVLGEKYLFSFLFVALIPCTKYWCLELQLCSQLWFPTTEQPSLDHPGTRGSGRWVNKTFLTWVWLSCHHIVAITLHDTGTECTAKARPLASQVSLPYSLPPTIWTCTTIRYCSSSRSFAQYADPGGGVEVREQRDEHPPVQLFPPPILAP